MITIQKYIVTANPITSTTHDCFLYVFLDFLDKETVTGDIYITAGFLTSQADASYLINTQVLTTTSIYASKPYFIPKATTWVHVEYKIQVPPSSSHYFAINKVSFKK